MGIWLIVSQPPAMITSDHPARILAVASAIDWSPDEQKRFMVMPEVRSGNPAPKAMTLPRFMPCSASGKAQPTMRSSTSSGLRTGTLAHEPFHNLDADLVGPRCGEPPLL